MLHGRAEAKPQFLSGREAIVWSRHYSTHDAARCDCDQLAAVLARLPGAERLVREARGCRTGLVWWGWGARR